MSNPPALRLFRQPRTRRASWPRRSGSRRSAGFTLIEILVVVSIIALLIAILLPSLRAARLQSQATICGTHFEQVFNGIFMYTQDSRDLLPQMGFRGGDPGWDSVFTWMWFTQIAKYVRKDYDVYMCPTDDVPDKYMVVFNKGKIRLTKPGEAGTLFKTSFRGGCDLLDEGSGVAPKPKTWVCSGIKLHPMPRKITDFNRPAMSLGMIEGILASISTQPCFRFDQLSWLLDPAKIKQNAPLIASFKRHSGRTNFLFLDGHVGRHTIQQAYDKLPYQQQFIDTALMRKRPPS